jgi:two-component system, chemotaxis family, protein-glutamate methylesterase/glutaminase
VAQELANTAVGILMTGMGDDGAEGLGAIKAAGGVTIAQSEDTCVVGGMPRAAIIKGYATKVLPLDGMANYLISQYGGPHAGDKTDCLDKNEKQNERVPVSTPRA